MHLADVRSCLLVTRGKRVLSAVVVAVAACHRPEPSVLPSATASLLEPVSGRALCVQAGRVGTPTSERLLRVDHGGVRAVIAGDRSRSAEIAFAYRGPSKSRAPLASGELRRQIGLKLRAQDTCNVVYVMWHVEPSPGVFVSVKRNAGASTHGECGDRGYDNLRPEASAAAPALEANAPHVLRADIDADQLRVTADAVVVWRGRLPAQALEFDGPAGFRTDNGTFDLELRVPRGYRSGGVCPPR